MKKVLVLGVKQFDQRVVMIEALAGHRVVFADAPRQILGECKTADVLVLHVDHENQLKAFADSGFDGAIIPLLGNGKHGIRINNVFVDAVGHRQVPGRVIEILAGQSTRQREVAAK